MEGPEICEWCEGQAWGVFTDEDLYVVVQRCDCCEVYENDEAAVLSGAPAALGIFARETYPCYVLSEFDQTRNQTLLVQPIY